MTAPAAFHHHPPHFPMAMQASTTTNDDTSIESLSDFLATTVDFGLATSATSTSRKRRASPKEELAYLRVKHADLVAQYSALQSAQPWEESSWKAKALAQAQNAQKARHENESLKTTLHESLKLLQALQHVLHKRPKLAHFPIRETDEENDLWRRAILRTTQRHSDLERLMALQYDKLETEWIRHGLFDAIDTNTPLKSSLVQSAADDNAMELHFLRTALCPLPFRAMADLLWDHMTSNVPGTTQELLYAFEPDLVYIRLTTELSDAAMPALESRLAGRRWTEADRVVIAWRSIIEDRLVPHDDNHLIENRVGWVTVHARSETECFFALYAKSTTPMFPQALRAQQPAVGTLTEIMLRLHRDNSVKFAALMKQAMLAKMAEQGIEAPIPQR
ncbi:hypothetical protein, variant [Saprolegnia diclina VS20]|uniref:START domain-containing protein n=1 Tax=Saprolegnia diclina (strain VS20) TaxID=1156394 RepID=T0QBN8_SAPDV|nr:hypothetical protein SDRG_07036 [Saprolegnia diclina VS20]XP_008611075.1 hypothetical protein, variant [Saprolegnia diclina VS20]EQC35324.1 hypothetical protein SDRG_07036 [Saprolegnia diclina VS20]EQC35325.1 hypothetical protein, variant [Saprolegnia diclina VS20]|eukprot:XP_008611074.1 hypothetical protein SDRG_07036 [Saprolegnia diclina VS20]